MEHTKPLSGFDFGAGMASSGRSKRGSGAENKGKHTKLQEFHCQSMSLQSVAWSTIDLCDQARDIAP